MRCPKCGYISFDHSESCGKCGKDISSLSTELNGVGYQVKPPSFLNIEYDDEEPEAVEATPVTAESSFEHEKDTPDAEDEFLELGITDDTEEVAVEEEQDGELAEGIEFIPGAVREDQAEKEKEELELPPSTIDFDGLDLSDLAPPETAERDDEPGKVEMEENMFYEPSSESDGLEDLQLDDIDIDDDAISFSPMDKDKKKKKEPGKTGTALDEFDFDLGEL